MLHASTIVLASGVFASMSLGGVITAGHLQNGETAERLAIESMNIDIDVFGGQFKLESKAGYDIMGISGGAMNDEIDHNESMLFSFDQAVNITSLELGLLFVNGQHGDRVNEGALVTINDSVTFELRLREPTKADWNGNGQVFAHSQGLEGSAGVFEIAHTESIFGMQVTSLELHAPDDGINGGAASDYGFTSMTFESAVPTPGALSMLALGGLVATKRRR